MSYDNLKIERLAGILHTLACTKEHATQMESLLDPNRPKELCYFYLEETLVSDERPAHKEWAERALGLCKSCNLTAEEILRMIPVLLECRQKLSPFLTRNPTSEELCRLFLFSEL